MTPHEYQELIDQLKTEKAEYWAMVKEWQAKAEKYREWLRTTLLRASRCRAANALLQDESRFLRKQRDEFIEDHEGDQIEREMRNEEALDRP